MGVGRSRRSGQIEKRGDGKWMVRVFLGRDDQGKRHFHSKTIHGTKRDAEAYRRRVQGEVHDGTFAQPTRETVGGFLDRWIRDVARHRVRAKTLETYRTYLERYVKPGVGLRRLRDLRPDHVQALYSTLTDRGLSGRTVRLVHAVFSNALDYACKVDGLPRNPAKLVDLPRQTKTEMRALSQEQAAKLIEVAGQDPHGLVIVFALATGMRPSEYCALRWSDINFDARAAVVRRSVTRTSAGCKFDEPKTSRSKRTVSLPSSLVRSLRTHRARQLEARLKIGRGYQDNDLVFATEIGTPLDARNLGRRHLKRLLREAGLPDYFRLYDLRHSAATLLIEGGIDARTVADRLGHADVSMTLGTYTHVTITMQERATERLDEVLFGGRKSSSAVCHTIGTPRGNRVAAKRNRGRRKSLNSKRK